MVFKLARGSGRLFDLDGLGLLGSDSMGWVGAAT